MTDNYDSDTLRQQRKSREDFLKLKKMQSGEFVPDEPNSPAPVQTPKDKVKNFWYYNRYFILIGLFLAVVITVLIAQCVSKPEYDLTVTVYTLTQIGESDCDKISEYFKKFTPDANGDGKIYVQVINCSYDENSNRQAVYVSNAKFQSIITVEKSFILFITDEKSYEKINSISKEVDFFEEKTTALPDDFYNFCEADDLFPLPKNLFISKRIISDEVLKSDDKIEASNNTASEVMSRIENIN